MSKQRESKKKKEAQILKKSLIFLAKTPYYFGRGIYHLVKNTNAKLKKDQSEKVIKEKRDLMKANYKSFEMIHKVKGDFKEWENSVRISDSKIGIILGARGTGKTAFGLKFLENIYAKDRINCQAMGFQKSSMPSWIKVIEDINEVENNSFILVDEGGVLFSSRKFMSSANKLLSELILIARHKNLNILFISQNSSNLDINILRQADFLILKPSSLLQKDFERKIIQKIYEDTESEFEKFKEHKGLTYIYSKDFNGFVANPLPSFWKIEISKSFK